MKGYLAAFHLGLAFMLFLTGCLQSPSAPHVSSSMLSHDGKCLAEVVELWVPERDRRFEVRISRKDLDSSQPLAIYQSPDEGRPDERLLWSSDNRHVLLVGKYLAAGPEFVTDTGETIYLLYNVQTGEIRCNSSQLQPRLNGFDFDDLARIEFPEKFRSAHPNTPENRM